MDNIDDGFSSSIGKIIDELKVENQQVRKAMCSMKCEIQHKPLGRLKGTKAVTLREMQCPSVLHLVIRLLNRSTLFTVRYTFQSHKSADSQNVYFIILNYNSCCTVVVLHTVNLLIFGNKIQAGMG